jgi:outer membrane protein assembly factor BamB
MSAPVKQPVKIGNVQLSPEEFERLAAEYRQARAGDAAAAIAWLPSSPAPGKYQVKPIGRIAGNDVQPPPNLPAPDLDWPARQTAVAVAPQLMLVSNRAMLVAFNPADGRMLWEQRIQTDKSQQSWPMVPLRPVVAGSRVYVRRLLKDGPVLSCLDAANGRQLWQANPDTCVASDPLLSGQDVFVLALRTVYPQKLVLSLCRIDAASGEVVAQTPLCEFFDAWRGMLPCQAALIDDKIVATLGGAVLCCDLTGRLHWMRQQVWIPPKDADANVFPWFAQVHEPPLLSRDRLLVTQPGMRSVECLDAATGRLLWQQTIPRLIRVVGSLNDRLVVATGEELLGLDTASGKITWRHETPQRLEASVCGWPGGVLCVQPEKLADPNAPRRPALVWLDAQTGKVVREQVLETAPQAKPTFGPLLANGTRQWLLVGSPQQPLDKEIWELTLVP